MKLEGRRWGEVRGFGGKGVDDNESGGHATGSERERLGEGRGRRWQEKKFENAAMKPNSI